MMQSLFGMVMYLIQIGVTILIAVGVSYLVCLFIKKERIKVLAAVLLFVLCFSAEWYWIVNLANHPRFVCPPEYREFVSEEEKRELIHVNSGGFNKYLILFMPDCIEVTYADEVLVVAEAKYSLLGTMETRLGDGISRQRKYS